MAFVPHRRYDVFASYARVDDEPLPGTEQGWVTTLVQGLRTRLAQRLGRSDAFELRIDHELGRDVQTTTQITNILQDTAVLLVVLSPGYVASQWCARENGAFLNLVKERVRSGSRVFVVERDVVEDSRRPSALNEDVTIYRFWERQTEGRPPCVLGSPKPKPDDHRYYDQVTALSYDLADELERLRAAASFDETAQQLTSPYSVVPGGGAQDEHGTIESVLEHKIETADFDVFLCHNSADKPAVKEIGQKLKARGILPWLDEWELRPGLPWQDVLNERIKQIKTAAVFVSSQGLGPWQNRELYAFLRQFIKRGSPVIPVLLPDAPHMPDLPVDLDGMTWVDFRKQDPDPMSRLIWGITGTKTDAARGAVFLAEVTDDLDPQRDNAKRYLEQAGLRVLPVAWYPREPHVFQQAAQRDLAKCKLFVQLLGGTCGKKSPDLPQGYARLQFECAKEAGKPILQWRSRELDVASITDADHRAFLELDTVLATGIEEFKRKVKEHAFSEPQPTGARSPVHAFVFVSMETEDKSIADAVCAILKDCGADIALPLRSGKPAEIRKDLEQNLLDCDGVIIIYGSITVTWVNEQLRKCRKVLAQRERPVKALAVFEGPPGRKAPPNLILHNMRILDCCKGFDESMVRAFVNSLQAK